MKRELCPKCEASREELAHLQAIAEEAAKVSVLIQRQGTLTEEVQGALHALDFELLEYGRIDS